MSQWLPAVGAAVSSVSAPGLCNARHAWHCPRNSSSPSACRSTRLASLSLLHSFLVFCGAFPATLALRVSAWFLSPAKCLLPISTENPALTASTLPSHRFDSLISISFISKFSCLLNTLVILLSFQPQLSKKKKRFFKPPKLDLSPAASISIVIISIRVLDHHVGHSYSFSLMAAFPGKGPNTLQGTYEGAALRA